MFDRAASPPRADAFNLFFAIMMDRETGIRLGWHRSQISRVHGLTDDPIEADRLHMTLLGIAGGSGAPRQEILMPALRAAGGLRVRQFGIELGSVESFAGDKKKKPLVATETSPNEPLLAFQRQLRDSIREAGIPLPRQGSSRPHVTLAWDRAALPAPLRIRPISMIAREFALVLSHVGQSRYDLLGRWRLIPW